MPDHSKLFHTHPVTSNLGSRYLLKRPCKSRSCVPGEGIRLALLGLALEEFGDSLLRVAFDDQSLLLGAGFTLSALRLLLLWHVGISSYSTKLVPEPGIGPGRLVRARGCKPRLSASSSTRGPQAKGPHIAALRHLSKWNVVVSKWSGFVKHLPVFFFLAVNLSRIMEPRKNLVNRGHRRGQSAQIISAFHQCLSNIYRRHTPWRFYDYAPYRISEAEGWQFIAARIDHSCQRGEMAQHLIEVGDLMAKFYQLILKIGPALSKHRFLTVEVVPCLAEVFRFHTKGGYICLET
jgi:hypothetical protein